MKSTELRTLQPESLLFARSGVDLRLTIDGDCSYPKVTVVRAFPLSHPTRWLSVRSGPDEVGVIADLAQLQPESQRLVKDALDRRYLTLRIARIYDLKERFSTLEWDVETDRGRCRFTTRSLRENSSSPSPERYLVSDVDGNRYDVAKLSALDRKSQALLLRHF
jgi:Domain of unknown function (DUF1854)